MNEQNKKHDKHEHYILPDSKAIKTGLALFVLTAITVGVAHLNLGYFNFLVALLVASIKAFLVASIFMNLSHDKKENSVIFATGFVFLLIFVVLTASDLFTRGDISTRGKTLLLPVAGQSQFKKAWEPTAQLVEHGKKLYDVQCASCHGLQGKGDGVAAAALNPKPRNFTADAGWKNGRKPSMVFKTLKEGIAGTGMGSFSTLPSDDRWALSHYVITLGPNVTKDTDEDYKKIGLDPTKEESGSDAGPSITIDKAMKLIIRDSQK